MKTNLLHFPKVIIQTFAFFCASLMTVPASAQRSGGESSGGGLIVEQQMMNEARRLCEFARSSSSPEMTAIASADAICEAVGGMKFSPFEVKADYFQQSPLQQWLTVTGLVFVRMDKLNQLADYAGAVALASLSPWDNGACTYAYQKALAGASEKRDDFSRRTRGSLKTVILSPLAIGYYSTVLSAEGDIEDYQKVLTLLDQAALSIQPEGDMITDMKQELRKHNVYVDGTQVSQWVNRLNHQGSFCADPEHLKDFDDLAEDIANLQIHQSKFIDEDLKIIADYQCEIMREGYLKPEEAVAAGLPPLSADLICANARILRVEVVPQAYDSEGRPVDMANSPWDPRGPTIQVSQKLQDHPPEFQKLFDLVGHETIGLLRASDVKDPGLRHQSAYNEEGNYRISDYYLQKLSVARRGTPGSACTFEIGWRVADESLAHDSLEWSIENEGKVFPWFWPFLPVAYLIQWKQERETAIPRVDFRFATQAEAFQVDGDEFQEFYTDIWEQNPNLSPIRVAHEVRTRLSKINPNQGFLDVLKSGGSRVNEFCMGYFRSLDRETLIDAIVELH